MKSLRNMIPVGLACLAAGGCAAYANAFGVKAPTLHAANPLGGTPLSLGRTPSPDAHSCDRPFDTEGFTLSATSDQVCMEETALFFQHPSLPAPSVASIDRVLWGSTPDKKVITLASQGGPENVSRCSGQASGEVTVWRQEFKGCVANEGLIVASTKAVSVARDDGKVDHDRPMAGTPEQARIVRWELTAAGSGSASEKSGATAPQADGDGSGATSTTSAKTDPSAATGPRGPTPTGYKADVRKCMNGQAVGPGSMVGAGTCRLLQQAAKSGDDSNLPKGAQQMFREIRGGG